MIIKWYMYNEKTENFLLIIRRIKENANNNTLIYSHNSFL